MDESDIVNLSATQAVEALKNGSLSPLELLDAAEQRVSKVEPLVNALPTLCFERARERAKRLMREEQGSEAQSAGWLAGLPITIKDMTDVEGVRTTYGSPLFRDHIAERSHPLVERLERLGGIIIAKSNTPEFAVGASTFNDVFGRTANPWNTSLTCGGSSGGAAVSVATGEAWLAHGNDMNGSLRRPATYCGVVGLRPSPGRVTRGAVDDLFSPLMVEGPIARDVKDAALFLDAMAGYCLSDPMTIEAPALSYVSAVASARLSPPKRVGYVADFGGKVPVDRETLALCQEAVRKFELIGCEVDELVVDIEGLEEAALILRSQAFVVEHEAFVMGKPEFLKQDIIWNTEFGLTTSPSKIAWAHRRRAAFYRDIAAAFGRYDVLVTPGASTPAFDIQLRHPATIAGKELEHYLSGSMLNGAITLTSCPALSLPCCLDRFGRPVGLQMVGPPHREDRLLQVASLFEELVAWSSLPIMPKAGTVPPAEMAAEGG
uniref:amidase n=1 Tax=Variovorax sp. BK018 TaxID=3450241 RepID=UPI004039C530